MEPINWAAIEERAAKAEHVLSQGEHLLRCEEADWDVASTGKRMIRYRYTAASPGPEQGSTVFGQQVLTEGNAPAERIFLRYLRAHGVNPVECQSQEQITAMMVGKIVLATVRHEVYNGETRARADNFRPQPGVPAQAMGQIAPQQASQPVPQAPAAPRAPYYPQAPQPQHGAPAAPAQPMPQPAPAAPMGIPQPAPQAPQAPAHATVGHDGQAHYPQQGAAPQPQPAGEPVVAQAQQQVSEFLAGDTAQMFQQN